MKLIDRDYIRAHLPRIPEESYKQQRGHVWICGGSVGYSGAPRLAARGAQGMGAGLVSLIVPDEVYPVIAAAELETMVHPQSAEPDGLWHADAVVAGPGWGRMQEELLRRLLVSDRALVLDADALNMLADNGALVDLLRGRGAPAVLTPHPGEAARLLGWSGARAVQADRDAALRALLAHYGGGAVTVVLKGAESVVGDGGASMICPCKNSRLSVAGSGDVLAGMVAVLLAQGLDAFIAATCAVGVHGLMGEVTGWYRAGEMGDVVARLCADLRA